jgi:hypothetical protein
MFEPSSRYYSIEDAEYTAPDGRLIPYKRRRFLPHPMEMPLLSEVIVIQSDRLDLIATRTLRNPEHFWRICDANNAMNPFDLIAEIGRRLRVPVP